MPGTSTRVPKRSSRWSRIGVMLVSCLMNLNAEHFQYCVGGALEPATHLARLLAVARGFFVQVDAVAVEAVVEQRLLVAQIGDKGFAAHGGVQHVCGKAQGGGLADGPSPAGKLQTHATAAAHDQGGGAAKDDEAQLQGQPGMQAAQAPVAGDGDWLILPLDDADQAARLEDERGAGWQFQYGDFAERIVAGRDGDGVFALAADACQRDHATAQAREWKAPVEQALHLFLRTNG